MTDPPGALTDHAPRFSAPVLLTRAHDHSAFDSGEPVLDDWLRERAWSNLQMAAGRTYVVCPDDSNRIIGYYALSMGQILGSDATGAMRRNMPRQIPAVMLVVIIGRLAIDRAWHGRKMGTALLADAVRRAIRASDHVMARLIIVHAISPAAEAFYIYHGFTRLPTQTPTLALDLLKLGKIGVEG